MTEKYFKIYNSDGDTSVNIYTKSELLAELNEELSEGNTSHGFLTEEDIREYLDTNYWDNESLIIKGKVVNPKPKKVITEYEVE